MDSLFALLGLIFLALSVYATRYAKNGNLFSFAFLFPAVTVAFVLVEFLDFMLNAGILYEYYSEAGTVTIALFMIASCSFFAILGHTFGSRKIAMVSGAPADLPAPAERDIRYMHIASIVVAGTAFVAFLILVNLSGGFQSYLFNSGTYALEWTGLPVYLIFVVRLIYASIVIQLWLWVRTKRAHHLRWALIFAIIPIINIVFIFRRAEVVKVGVFFGYFLTNYRYISIGRIPALLGLVGMYGVLKIFPFLRSESGRGLDFDELVSQAMVRENYQASEIASGLLRIAHTASTQSYEYGSLFYNSIIKQFVPAGLVGPDFKAQLMIQTAEMTGSSFATYRFYVSPMGFAQAYQQFWLLGGLIFFVLGYYMTRLERDRFYNRRKEILLVIIFPAAISAVSADLRLFLPQLIIYSVVVFLCVPKERRQRMVVRAPHSGLTA